MSRDLGRVPTDPRFSTLDWPVTPHSLHPWHSRPVPPAEHAGALAKPDRLLVGFLAGAALFYLLGRALGLGRDRMTHAEP